VADPEVAAVAAIPEAIAAIQYSDAEAESDVVEPEVGTVVAENSLVSSVRQGNEIGLRMRSGKDVVAG
jgi:hypothetical protein